MIIGDSMKNKFLFIILLAFIFVGVVNADTTSPTGVSGDSFRVTAEIVTSGTRPSLKMTVTAGIPDSSEVELAYALFSTSATGATTYPSDIVTDNNDFTKYKTVNVTGLGDDKVITVANSWLVTNYDYVNIFYKKTDGTFYYTNSAVHIERPSLKIDGSKYRVTLDTEGKVLTVLPGFPVDNCSGCDVNIEVKIGQITSADAILADALVEYAQNSSSGDVYTTSNLGDGKITYSTTIEDGKYYYIYMHYKNENGKTYYNTEDALLAKGGSNGLLALVDGQHGAADPGDEPQPDQPDQPGEPDGPVENPYTGLSVGIVGMLLFAAGMVILLVTNKRKMYRI